MNVSPTRLALLCLLLCAACDEQEQCVADCDAASGQTGPGSTSTATAESATGLDPTQPSVECVEVQEAQAAFYEENSSCNTLLDCRSARAECFPPGVPAACTGIALAASADFDAWADLDEQASSECASCVFEGDCGAVTLCDEEQRCVEGPAGPSDACKALVERDVDTFLAENTACVEDEDCVSVPSCTGGDACRPVALNTSADLDDWERLESAFTEWCDGFCTMDEDCDAPPRCGESGRCEIAP